MAIDSPVSIDYQGSGRFNVTLANSRVPVRAFLNHNNVWLLRHGDELISSYNPVHREIINMITRFCDNRGITVRGQKLSENTTRKE